MGIFDKIDREFERELSKEGLTPIEARLVAGTELNGVSTEKDGSYADRRTACHVVGRRGGQWRCQETRLLSRKEREEANKLLREL